MDDREPPWGTHRELLQGLVPAQSLPRDLKSISPERRLSSRVVSLGPEVTRELGRRAEESGSDVATWLLTAFFALLAHYTEESDLAVGWFDGDCGDPPANGSSIRVWVIRATALPGIPFRDLISDVQRARERALGLGSIPTDEIGTLLEEPGLELAVDPIPVRFRMPELATMRDRSDDFGGKLGLTVRPLTRGVQLRFAYDASHFEDAFVGCLAEHYATLLGHAIAAPSTALEDLELKPPGEEERLHAWELGGRSRRPCHSPGFPFSEHVARAPDRTALEFAGGSLTYGELEARANQVGHALQSRGVGVDVPVALRFVRSPELVIAAVGVLKAGGALVFLDPAAPSDRIRLLLELIQPALMLTGDPPPDGLAATGCRVLPFAEVATGPSIWRESDPASGLPPDRTAILLPTSGSTGRPRVIRGTLAYLRPWADFGPDDRHVLKSDSGTAFTSAELTRPLSTGGTLVIAPPGLERGTRELIAFVGRERISCLLATPTQLAEILAFEDLTPCETLRVVECVGERWPEGLGRRFARRLGARSRLLSTYGCTEAPGATTRPYAPGDETRGLVDVGRPAPGMEVLVLDRRARRSPVGIPGEIHVGGLIAHGYLRDEEADRERFVSHPFAGERGDRVFRTGDRGRWLCDGNLEVLGREDDQLKVRGFRVEPGEIESRLLQDSRVAECAVALREDERGEKLLVAYWVPRDGASATASSLRRHLLGHLPEGIIPSRFVALERLPRTPNGKLDRRALPALGGDRPELDSAYAIPGTPTEKSLHDIWAGLLGLGRVGVCDSFFDLGGHSILAARLFTRIASDLGVELPLSTLFHAATIRGLAARIDAGPAPIDDDRIAAIRPSGSKRPLFLLHSLGGDLLFWRELLPGLDPDRPIYGVQPARRQGVLDTYPRFVDLAAAHVEALRRVQPRGPYSLAGYSFGGFVAFEMAHALKSAGEDVEFLGLIDSLAPGYPEILPAWRRVLGLARTARDLPANARLAFLAQRARSLLRKVPTSQLLGLDEVDEAGPRELPSWPAFEPRPYPGRLTLFRAEQQPEWPNARTDDATNGWGRLALGDLEVRVVPGSHLSLLSRPNVEALAQSLSACLADAERRGRAIAACGGS